MSLRLKGTQGEGICLFLDDRGTWTLHGAASTLTGTVSKDVTKQWTTLGIRASGTSVTVSIDSETQTPVATAKAATGMISINSGYNVAYFDNFAMKRS